MDVKIESSRSLNDDEIYQLKRYVDELWKSQQLLEKRIAVANVKVKAWMATNKFTKIVNNATNNNVVNAIKKGAKIAAGVTVGSALLLSSTLPIVPMISAGATIGAYVTASATEALHNISGRQYNKSKQRTQSAQETLEELQAEYYIGDIAYKTAKSLLDEERERIRIQKEEEYKRMLKQKEEERERERIKKEEEKLKKQNERREKWDEFKQDIKDDWANFKQDVKDGWTDFKEEAKDEWIGFKQDVKDEWIATKAELADIGRSIKQGAINVSDAVKNKFLEAKDKASNALNRVKENVNDAKLKAEAKRAEREANRIIQEELRRKRALEEAERSKAEAEENARLKQERKNAKIKNKSKKCLNFLMSTSGFLGKNFISSHLLTEEDKASYDGVRRALEEERELQAERINQATGASYTSKDIARMSDKQIERLEYMVYAVNNSNLRKVNAGATI